MRRAGFSYFSSCGSRWRRAAASGRRRPAAAAAFLHGLADALPDEPEALAETLGAGDGMTGRGTDDRESSLTSNLNNGINAGVSEYEPDIRVPLGVGAKGKEILVLMPDGTEVPLVPGTRITNVETIGGKGRNRQIDEIDVLMYRFPGTKENEWMKKKGIGCIMYKGEQYRCSIHFYEEPSVGRVTFKLKPDAAGNWFYED